MKPHIFMMYGRSGSGKGTQAELLKKYLKKEDTKRQTLYFSTGGNLRNFAQKNTHTSRLIQETLNKGGLLPSFIPIWAWGTHFIECFTGEEHIILDGVARRIPEPEVLESAFLYYKFEVVHIVFINVSREWAYARLMERGRFDDNDNDIKKRLDWYEEETVPAVEFFRNKTNCTFHDIDGEQTIDEVHNEIILKIFAHDTDQKS